MGGRQWPSRLTGNSLDRRLPGRLRAAVSAGDAPPHVPAAVLADRAAGAAAEGGHRVPRHRVGVPLRESGGAARLHSRRQTGEEQRSPSAGEAAAGRGVSRRFEGTFDWCTFNEGIRKMTA